MNNTDALLSGYTRYTDAEEFGASVTAEPPASFFPPTSPVILPPGPFIPLPLTVQLGC